MTQKVAIIDDETIHIEYYIDALSAKAIRAVHYKSPASCITAIESGERFDLFILDLMMPSHGAYTKEETSNGLLTGALLSKDVRSHDPEVPLIILTNMNVDSVLDSVQTLLSDVPNAFLLRKSEYPPHELAEIVHAILDEGISPTQRKGILRRLWDGLILEPNFFGMGINLRKLIK